MMESRPELVLAAHGSREDPGVNERLKELGKRLTGNGLFGDVRVAFHLGTPSFSTVLDESRARDIVIVPLMTSGGYFNTVVLPQELARNNRYPEVRIRVTPPIGEHPGAVSLVEQRAKALLIEYKLEAHDTALAIVGHGTSRNAESCRATENLAAKLVSRRFCGEVMAAFLDQSPSVETVPERMTKPVAIVIPFMIADGPHTIRDIPARLGMHPLNGDRLPTRATIEGRELILDRAMGEDPALESLITSLAEAAA